MKLKAYIYLSVLVYLVSGCSKPAEEVFIINKSMRCKPAAKYLKNIDSNTSDSLIYQLKLKNTELLSQEILIEIPIQQIDKINVLQIKDKQVIKNYSFESKKLSQRIYYDRNIIFPFTITAETSNDIFFIFHKDDIHNYLKPELLIWKKDAKIARTQALELTRGVFYGILILYTFICFLITYLLNVRNYYYYLLYLIAGIFYLFVKNNLGYELLWPDHPSIDIFLKKIMLSIYLITSILFLRGFIQKRIVLPKLQYMLRYFILFGLLLIAVSLIVGLFSAPAQKTFIIIQNVFAIVCLSTVIITFIFVYFNTNDRSIVLFSLLYFISFSFFLFYPQPEFGSDIFGVYLGQIYTYSNAFIIATIISISTVYRVIQIIKENEKLKKELSLINSLNNFSLIQGQQIERIRIGRELHDGIGIMMSAVKMKISSLKVNNKKDEIALKQYTDEIDAICSNIRIFSHKLLPPTLKKFGIQVALKDMFEQFKHKQNTELTYNFNIPDNLSTVSQHLIYDLIQHYIDYFTETKPTQINISIYVIPSISETQIRIHHSNSSTDMNNEHIKSVISVIDLLNGKFSNNMINAKNYRIHMEFPIMLE